VQSVSSHSQPDQADIRQRILDTALREFAAKGYHRAILDEIAARAGVSKGAVYWHFENKRALFLTVVQREIFRLTAYLKTVIADSDQSAIARLNAFIVASLTYYTDHPEFCNLLKIFTSPGGPELNLDVEVMVSDDYRQLRAMVNTLIQEGVRRGELESARVGVAAPMLVAVLDGLMFQWVLEPQAVPLRELASNVASAFLEGIVKRTN
jgi:TetR/AcrR family acrAB operon transcriptional repressor